MTRSATSLVPPGTTRRALRESFTKLHPRHQLRNPVMFVVMTEDDYNNDRDPQLDKAVEVLLGLIAQK